MKTFGRRQAIQVLAFLTGGIVFVGCQSLKSNFNDAGNAVAVDLKPVWVQDTLSEPNHAFRKVNLSSPLFFKDAVIVANALDGVMSFQRENQQLNWKLPLQFGAEASGVLVGNQLLIGSLDGFMYSINADTGKVNWKYDTKAEITSPPLTYNNILYFLNGANSLFSLDLQSGRQLWVYNRQETTTKMTIRGGSRPTFSNGVIYSGFSDGALVALNASTGTPQWEVSLNKNSRFKDIDATPVIDGENIYINSYDDKLYCLSKQNGSILWRYNTGGATAPVITGNKLYFSTSAGSVVSLNKTNGLLEWKKDDINGIATEPIIVKGFLVYGESQGPLKLVDLLTGKTQASFDPGKGIMSKISSDGGRGLYFVSGEANFYQVNIVPVTKGMIPFLIN